MSKKHTGSIVLRKDGVYAGKIQYKGIKKQFYSTDKTVVERKLQNFIDEMRTQNVNECNALLFSEYAEQYLITYKYGFIKDSSYDRLETVLKNQIRGTNIDIPLYQLDDILLQQYLNQQARCLSLSLLKKVYQLIRLVLSYAYRKCDISVDYAGILVFPSCVRKPKKVEVYTDDEIIKLVANIEKGVQKFNKYRLYRYAYSYLVILNTGLRCGEILALNWKDIDLNNKIIHVRHSLSHVRTRDGSERTYTDIVTVPKTVNSIRDIPVNDYCLKCLQWLHEDNLKRDAPSEYVVHSPSGDLFRYDTFVKTFKRICENSEVEYKGLHALRHTFASRLVQADVPYKTVSALLGHSCVSFTLDTYVHVYDLDKLNAIQKLPDWETSESG